MTLKHNLALKLSVAQQMHDEAVEDNEDYAVECINALMRLDVLQKEELEQLRKAKEIQEDDSPSTRAYKVNQRVIIDEVLG